MKFLRCKQVQLKGVEIVDDVTAISLNSLVFPTMAYF